MRISYDADDVKSMLGCVFTKGTHGEYWLLGYDGRFTENATVPRYTLTSLRDGMVQPPRTADDMANHLTETDSKPLAQWQMAENLIIKGKVGCNL